MVVSCLPIIAICGTTGVGKSKLAVELALHVNHSCRNAGWRCAKVINADAMQVYQGLDILTNKVPETERQGIPHLLMGFKKPGEQYVVGEWVQDTINLIDDMHKNNELPIVVGGTSYWMQHLIFPNRLVAKESSVSSSKNTIWSESLERCIASLPPELVALLYNLPDEAPSAKLHPDQAFRLHKLLSALDPTMSQRWHWKDTRKVLRSLEILKECGRLPSSIIAEQAASNAQGSQPRFRTLCFWLYANPSSLTNRLDSRVDEMISHGLLDEVVNLRELAKSGSRTDSEERSSTSDYTVGIYQSIGFREFCNYLDAPSEAAYKEAMERMKISTRQYAKRQISWIRNKLIPVINAANIDETIIPLYLLDATTLGNAWMENVQVPAAEIQDGRESKHQLFYPSNPTVAFLEGHRLPDPRMLSENAFKLLSVSNKVVDPTSILQSRKRRICPACTVQSDRPVMIEEGSEWNTHVKTRSHRRMAAKSLPQADHHNNSECQSKEIYSS